MADIERLNVQLNFKHDEDGVYDGRSLSKIYMNMAYRLPTEQGILKGVHNLRHTFGRRFRGAGVALETRKALLGHVNGDITTHYSAAELDELINAVEMIVDRGIVQSPTLMLVGAAWKAAAFVPGL